MKKTMRHHFRSGNVLDFSKEDIGYVTVEDLLPPLAQEFRFANQMEWSVLQHSWAVGLTCHRLFHGNIPLIRYAFFHDIHEAIIRDVPTPVKNIVGKAWWDMENDIQAKLFKALHLDATLNAGDRQKVHEVDRAMCFVELQDAFAPSFVEYYERECESKLTPSLVAECTKAFVYVNHQPIFTEDAQLHPQVIGTFKSVLIGAL